MFSYKTYRKNTCIGDSKVWLGPRAKRILQTLCKENVYPKITENVSVLLFKHFIKCYIIRGFHSVYSVMKTWFLFQTCKYLYLKLLQVNINQFGFQKFWFDFLIFLTIPLLKINSEIKEKSGTYLRIRYTSFKVDEVIN